MSKPPVSRRESSAIAAPVHGSWPDSTKNPAHCDNFSPPRAPPFAFGRVFATV
jgi:hypothetical protein